MYKLKILTWILAVGMTIPILSQTAHQNLRKGDGDYKSGNYSLAEDNYRKAWVDEKNDKGGFNLGNSIYQQTDRYEEAISQFDAIAKSTQDPAIKSKAFYNLGNAHYQNDAFDKSIEAYKKALKIDNEDLDVRKNLLKAMQQLRQQQQQQQQQQQDDKEDKKDEEQKDQEEQQQKDQQQQEQKPEDQQQEQQPEETRDLSKEEAEQLLKIIEQEEQKVQEKLRKASGSKKKPTKKW